MTKLADALQTRSGKLAADWLRSLDPRIRAWGAFLALQNRQTQLIPDLLSLLSAYEAIGDPASLAEKDQHDAMLAVLDTLIQLGAPVPLSDAAKIYPQFPAQSLLLVTRSNENSDSFLLKIFAAEQKSSGAWLVAGNLLAMRRVPGFAAVAMRDMTVHALIDVITPGNGVGGRGGSGACATSPGPEYRTGWPELGSYTLSFSGTNGGTLLVPGTDPAYYYRETGAPGVLAHDFCGPDLDRNLARQHYLTSLMWESGGNPPIRSEVSHLLTWQGEAAYTAGMLAFIQQQQDLFTAVAQRLIQQDLLTEQEAKTARPKLLIEIWDQRTGQTTPLPAIANAGTNVSFTGQ